MLPPGDIAIILPENADLPVPIGLPATVDTMEGEEKALWRKPIFPVANRNKSAEPFSGSAFIGYSIMRIGSFVRAL